MERFRVCQLITDLGPAGAERAVYEVSTRLDKDRFDVQVAALRGGPVAAWLEQAGVKVTVLGVRGRWDLGKLYRLATLLRGERIDLLHTHLFHADLIGRPAAGLAGVPRLVHTVHTVEGRFRPWHFAFARLFHERCDRIVCVSASVQADHAHRSGLPGRCYTVIPNGVDPDAFYCGADARRTRRAEWGLGEDDVLLAFIGRLDYDKGIDVLLGAMSHLGARGTPMNLVIAGDGPWRNAVETFIAHGEGGRYTRALGFVEDVQAVCSAADILVVPSRWEGFGLAAAEGMAAGLPVVATRVPGLTDLITDGQTGVLVEPVDVVALAEAMMALAGDAKLRVRLGTAARRSVVEKFSIDSCVAAHERLYADVAGELMEC